MVNFGAQNHSIAFAQHRSMYDDEDPYDAFFMPQQTMPNVETPSNPDVERLRALEDKFKSFEVHFTPSLDVVDMCLVPGLVIPKKFKVSDFDEYKGVCCPRTNLRAYCHKMATHINNDQLSIHYFMISSWGIHGMVQVVGEGSGPILEGPR